MPNVVVPGNFRAAPPHVALGRDMIGPAPPEPLRALTVPSLLDRTVAAFADRPALSFQGRKWSYAQLAAQVERATAGLQQLGLRQGDRIGLCLPNTPYFVIFYYAALKAGLVVVNYNPLYVARELRQQIEDSNTTTMVVPDLAAIHDKVVAIESLTRIIVCPFAAALPKAKRMAFSLLKRGMLARPAYGERLVAYSRVVVDGAAPQPVAIDPGDIAVLQYTGGTTGRPKGAMLTHANLSINAQQTTHHMPSMRPGEERMMSVLPFFHVYAMTSVLNGGISMGCELILHPRFEIGAMMTSLVRDRPTIMHAVPTIYNAIATAAERNRVDISSLRVCVSGGAPLPAEVRERFQRLTGCRVIEGYGLTEASPAVTSNPPDGTIRPDSVGIVLQDTAVEIRALDDINRILPCGDRGEICVRGPQVMQGYLNRPEETAASFIDGALRTGDVGYLDVDGYLFVTDRIKDLIICSGYNVYPRIIEDALYEHPAVAEAIVIAIPDAYRGQAPMAFVTLREGELRSGDELRDFLRDKLSAIEMPVWVEIRTSLPKTVIGKLSRKELIAEVAAAKPV
ncbi:long-chain-fatty-acid--CoA ligase [Rhodopila sp.]|uniref:long-chain-fatty-acid--CoA ligase n=1 Tax=Rhodopila sp. TaxID=2480087 RepID=UPI003D10C2F1